jgi:hypothetical protein
LKVPDILFAQQAADVYLHLALKTFRRCVAMMTTRVIGKSVLRCARITDPSYRIAPLVDLPIIVETNQIAGIQK